MVKMLKKTNVIVMAILLVLGLAAYSDAMMGGPVGSGTTTATPGTTTGGYTTGGMMGTTGYAGMGGYMMSNSGSFGMMNGMAGAPVVGDDGTAYMINFVPTVTAGTAPGSNSFQTNMVGVTPDGQTMSYTLRGIASRPIVEGNFMAATASLPELSNYTMYADHSSGVAGSQSVLYVMSLPFSSSAQPIAIAMDGSFASAPVIANNHIYVVTSDYGNGMMSGNGTFASMYGSYNFNGTGTARSYMYIFNMDGSLLSKTTIQ